MLSILVLSTSAMKLSWNDLQKAAGFNFSNTKSTWSHSSGGSDYSLVKHTSSINGKGAYDLLAIYLKSLIILLSNTDNEIRVVRLEVDCTGMYYKVLIRIKDCHGNKVYIGMLVDVCDGEIKIKKFFQSNEVEDIIKAFCFLDSNLYNYPDGDIGGSCSNSILDMLSEFCSAVGGSSNGHSFGSSNDGLQLLNDSGSSWSSLGSSVNGFSSDGIKLNIKVPGSKNPTGKTILLGVKKP